MSINDHLLVLSALSGKGLSAFAAWKERPFRFSASFPIFLTFCTQQGLDYVGLTLMHREHILSIDGSSMEFTNHEIRELQVVPASIADAHEAKVGKPFFTTRTIWTFGERKGEDRCTHCNHCSHTR